MDELEQCWPCFKETDGHRKCSAVEWGDSRCGRIPPFVRSDDGVDYSDPLSREAAAATANDKQREATRGLRVRARGGLVTRPLERI